jgi:aspartate/methionine/tyrosine aminotransferase
MLCFKCALTTNLTAASYSPQGAFYLLVDVSGTALQAREFCLALLESKKVAVAPGCTFGDEAKSLVRVSIAASDDDVRHGIGKLCEFIWERRTENSS